MTQTVRNNSQSQQIRPNRKLGAQKMIDMEATDCFLTLYPRVKTQMSRTLWPKKSVNTDPRTLGLQNGEKYRVGINRDKIRWWRYGEKHAVLNEAMKKQTKKSDYRGDPIRVVVQGTGEFWYAE
jgi:hypothetical protein